MIVDISEDHPEYARTISALNKGQCPDCQAQTMIAGPRGGASRNVSCASCGSRFNVAPWFDHVPHNFFFVQRIGD
jgi:ribosomal protein S27E